MADSRHFSSSLPFALFEDNLSNPPRARLLTGLRQHIQCVQVEDITTTFTALSALQAQGCWIALAANYELGHALEPKLLSLLKDDSEPLLQIWAFDHMTIIEGESLSTWWDLQLDKLSLQAREAGLLWLTPSVERDHYLDGVSRALQYIHEGDCYQVNLTFPMTGKTYGDPLALFARLRQTQPVRYGALIRNDDEWILSRSPELFVNRRGLRLECKPMKGTASRDDNAQRDAELASALELSAKDRAENLMIVDLIRNDLGRLTPPGGVRVERLFELETYRSVYQLTSTVVAEPVAAGIETVLHALFPCGSVTGAPKIRAMQIIDELEAKPRGLYCGALGWIAPDGDYTLNVPIRTLMVDDDSSCHMSVGSGVVADSVPKTEYEECLSKARFASVLCDEFQLIETLRYDASTASFPYLDRHLARLKYGAHALEFHFDDAAIRSKLHTCVTDHAANTSRVRVLLSRNGGTSLTTAPLDPISNDLTVIVSTLQLNPGDSRLRFKTTARNFYDTALSAAVAEGHFDVLFFNTNGELCEGTRTNVFLLKDGTLYTPPLSCGLLPGVMRQTLLDEGRAVERILYRNDLDTADRLFVANALRGLVEVRLVGRQLK